MEPPEHGHAGHAGALHIMDGSKAVIFSPHVPNRLSGHGFFEEFVVQILGVPRIDKIIEQP